MTTINPTGGPTGPGAGSTPGANENNYLGLAATLGINLEGFYDVDANGNKVLNMAKLMEAIKEAEAKKKGETTEAAGQADTFSRTTTTVNGTKTEAAQAKTEQEKIDEEYTKAFIEYYQSLNTAADASEEEKAAASSWADVKDMLFNLTKTGVTNATVIAGASEFVSKLDTAVKATAEANDEQPNEEETADDIFANNPFFQSAYDTTLFEEEEETIAA